MQFHCTEIKPVSNKYKQNKQLFRYFVGIDSLHALKSSTLNYEVKVANAQEVKNTTYLRVVLGLHLESQIIRRRSVVASGVGN